MSALRILIVDDEPPARQRLADLIGRETDADVIGEAATGIAAVERIQADRPDVVFLDVQMPGLTGLDVVREVGADAMPAVVFVTAYDRHAVEAFELAALDYLLKPYSVERFRQALSRVRASLDARQQSPDTSTDAIRDQLRALLGQTAEPSPTYAARISVETRGRVRFVPVDSIDYFTSDGAYIEAHAQGETHVIRERMQDLEARLDPALFARIHRSTLVRLVAIDSLLIGRQGDYAVRLLDGTRLPLARGRRDDLEARLSGQV